MKESKSALAEFASNKIAAQIEKDYIKQTHWLWIEGGWSPSNHYSLNGQ